MTTNPNLPPDWPMWLTPKLQERYRDATADLWRSIGDRRRYFDRAISVAVGEAERARQYSWPDRTVVQRIKAAKDSRRTIANTAVRLADHLERGGAISGHRLAWAAVESGVTFKVGAGRSLDVAVVAFLRALAKQDLNETPSTPNQSLAKRDNNEIPNTPTQSEAKQDLNGIPNRPSQSRGIGPFLVSCGVRATDPEPVTMLTVELAFLFRELLADRTTIRHGTPITGGECWDAAASFATAAFDVRADALAVKATALKWKRGKRIQWRGWRAK